MAMVDGNRRDIEKKHASPLRVPEFDVRHMVSEVYRAHYYFSPLTPFDIWIHRGTQDCGTNMFWVS